MWKWIVGGCLGLIALACVGLWLGYRQLKDIAAGGPTASTVIVASPQRVFASIANADSLVEWRLDARRVSAAHQGPLAVGDTLAGEMGGGDTTSTRRGRIVWVVTEFTRDNLIAFEAILASTGQKTFSRRDSLVAMGDSTKVVITFAATLMDSALAGRKVGPVGTGLMGMASTAMIAGLRTEAEQELIRLKARIEGRSVIPK